MQLKEARDLMIGDPVYRLCKQQGGGEFDYVLHWGTVVRRERHGRKDLYVRIWIDEYGLGAAPELLKYRNYYRTPAQAAQVALGSTFLTARSPGVWEAQARFHNQVKGMVVALAKHYETALLEVKSAAVADSWGRQLEL